MVYIKGYQAWVWIAYEPIKKLFLAFHISYRCNTIDAYLFIQELIKRYGRKAIMYRMMLTGTKRHAGGSGCSIMYTQ